MEADRVRDVPKRRRRIVDAECVGEIQTAELPGLGSRLHKLRRDGRLDHRPRPMPAGAAQLQVGAGECAVAARREQELEHLPRRTVDRDPRLDVRAEHPQQPVAIQRLQRLRFVAPNRQRVVSEHPSLLRGRETPAKIGGKRTRRQLPVETAQSRDQRGIQAVLNRGLRLLRYIDVGDEGAAGGTSGNVRLDRLACAADTARPPNGSRMARHVRRALIRIAVGWMQDIGNPPTREDSAHRDCRQYSETRYATAPDSAARPVLAHKEGGGARGPAPGPRTARPGRRGAGLWGPR